MTLMLVTTLCHFMMVTDYFGDGIIMFVIFSMYLIGHQHLKLVVNTFCLQHPLYVKMTENFWNVFDFLTRVKCKKTDPRVKMSENGSKWEQNVWEKSGISKFWKAHWQHLEVTRHFNSKTILTLLRFFGLFSDIFIHF